MNSNWDGIAAKWPQYMGAVKQQWGKLTEAELVHINGNQELLAHKLQEKYNITPAMAQQQIERWAEELKI
jgi:uncharacterized protein YjbJ (UPF0337 family)